VGLGLREDAGTVCATWVGSVYESDGRLGLGWRPRLRISIEWPGASFRKGCPPVDQFFPLLYLLLIGIFIAVAFIISMALVSRGLRDRQEEWPANWQGRSTEDTPMSGERRIAS
jgi:hypothetical protein